MSSPCTLIFKQFGMIGLYWQGERTNVDSRNRPLRFFKRCGLFLSTTLAELVKFCENYLNHDGSNEFQLRPRRIGPDHCAYAQIEPIRLYIRERI